MPTQVEAKRSAAKRPARADGPQPKVIEAEAFVVKDAAGRERGRFGVGDQGGELVLLDRQGRRRIMLHLTPTIDPESPHVSIDVLDEKGRDRVSVGFGEGNGPSVGIIGPTDETLVCFCADEKQDPRILLYNRKGEERGCLKLDDDGSPVLEVDDRGGLGFTEARVIDLLKGAARAPDWVGSVRHMVLTGEMTDLGRIKFDAEPDPTRRALLISAQNLMGELGDAWPSLSTPELALFVADLGRVVGPSVPPAMAR